MAAGEALLTAAALVTAGTVAGCGGGASSLRPSARPTASATANPNFATPSLSPVAAPAPWLHLPGVYITCPDPLFRAGAPIASNGSSGCGGLHFGGQALAADCTQGAIPSDLDQAAFDNTTNQPSDLGSVQADPGGCLVATPNDKIDVVLGHLTPDQPGSLIVVADFLQAPAPLQSVVTARCNDAGLCLRVAVSTDGSFFVLQGDTTLLEGNVNDDQVRVPALNVNAANRVIFSVKGSHAVAWINGRQIGAGETTLPDQATPVGFTVSSLDANRPVGEKLLHLDVYRAD